MDDLACRRHHTALPYPVQQPQADFVLKLFHRFSEGGLRGENGRGGVGKTTLTNSLDKCAQAAKVHEKSYLE